MISSTLDAKLVVLSSCQCVNVIHHITYIHTSMWIYWTPHSASICFYHWEIPLRRAAVIHWEFPHRYSAEFYKGRNIWSTWVLIEPIKAIVHLENPPMWLLYNLAWWRSSLNPQSWLMKGKVQLAEDVVLRDSGFSQYCSDGKCSSKQRLYNDSNVVYG